MILLLLIVNLLYKKSRNSATQKESKELRLLLIYSSSFTIVMTTTSIDNNEIHLHLEELMKLWDNGELSQVLKEHVIKYLPFLQLVNQDECTANA